MRHGVRLLPLLLIPALASPSLSRTWYITPDGSGDAPTIQAGIDSAAAADTVQLAPGVFFENTIWLERDIVLRGDCDDPASVVIDGHDTDRIMVCITATAVEGLTFRHGFADWQSWGNYPTGGGIYCRGNVDRIASCVFENNRALNTAGGMLVHTSSTVVHNCTFIGNESLYGGGIELLGGNPEVSDCLFYGNLASYAGGGIAIRECNAGVFRCLFAENTAGSIGGAINVYYASPTIESCVMFDNEAAKGGAITFDRAWVAHVRRCTIVGNRATEGGGLALIEGTGNVPWIESTLIAFQGSGGSVHTVDPMDPGLFVIRCCDIFGNTGGDWVPGIDSQLGQYGNLSVDPIFCERTDGDFTLAANSPCLPGNHPTGWNCGLIGALGQGCGPVALTPQTWARVKARYR